MAKIIKNFLDKKHFVDLKTYFLSDCNWFYKQHMTYNLNSTTAIYYLTTCNGYTLIDGKKIKSVENQIVIFDSNIKHQMVSQTDTPERIVINLNYF